MTPVPANGSGIRAVLFDAGNTLVYIDPVRMVDMLRAEGADTDVGRFRSTELEARRRLHEAIDDGHSGTEPEVWRDYFTSLFVGGGVPPDRLEAVGRRVRDAHAEDHMWTHTEEGTAGVLASLLDAGYRLAVISNADGRVESVLERCGLRGHFEFVIDSDVFGVEKPDPAIFLEGARRLGLEPASCLYVGDLYPVDYLGATGAGLSALLLDPLGIHDSRAPCVGRLAEIPGWLDGG